MGGKDVQEGELARFLAHLADRHTDPDLVFSLRLAETGLAALARPPFPAPGIAVIGPTQTGKSTVVNVIAGGEYVEVSPLAAHTRQASVLAVNAAECQPASLPPGLEVRHWSRSSVPDSPSCLIWDTPDFDSDASREYREQAAQVCALADLVVVVLSKEKYADQSVWTVLETIAPLGLPVIICLNKLEIEAPETEDAGDPGRSELDVLLPAVRRRLASHFDLSGAASILALPRVPGGALRSLLAHRQAHGFRDELFESLARRSPGARRAALGRLVRRHWTQWVAPVDEELACRREWAAVVDAGARSFVERYRCEYIDHSRHYDVARKAILGLLELLEIPAVAGPMSRARRVLTWPFHKLAGALGRTAEPGRDQELKVLDAAIEHYLLSLRREVLSRPHPWWRALDRELASREAHLKRDFYEAIDRYRSGFQEQIGALSEELYARLERNPVALNALRATRVGADAGGIVLAIKTGTLGVYDALFTPVMISLTSYLTESAVGQYLKTVIERMKRKQLEQVTAIILDTLGKPLSELQPADRDLFGVTEIELDRAASQMEALAP